MQGFHLAAYEMRDAYLRSGPMAHGGQRFDPSTGPAADPDLREVANMVGVQMGANTP